ncbi:Xaa-Pro aminopeptidase [Psychrobacter sp. 16-MNA-CIBAN-0192]|uniref:Xaa-Pro aminopeptidase n=1 Tax=Psychrobacter sp. 16-MNA-CIBAN-0192 TaxID=3140448 RepID=UPI00332646C3
MMITTVYKGIIITALLSTFSVLTACSTLPIQNADNTSAVATNPLTAAMPAIDRQGRIAYVEEQGLGAAKISSLYTIRPDGSDRQLIDQLNGYIYAPAWSADGKQLAYSKQAQRQPPKIYVYDTRTHAQTLVVGGKGSHLSAAFSPDGQKLLYSSTASGNADIYELRLSDGSSTQLTTIPSTEVQPSYAPDGKSFVYVSDKSRAGRPRIYRYNFATKKSHLIATSGYAASPQLSLDGQRMAYLNGRQAAVMTLATGQVLNLGETGLDEPARLSPSGSYAVYPMQNAPHSGQKGSSLVIRALSNGASYTISSKSGGLARSPVWGR